MPGAPPPPLPTCLDEARRRGWDELDVVLVSGDAYVDHPAFAAAILGRVLEAEGYRVGVIAQPDWRSAYPFRVLGRPRLFFGVSGGNVDSMLAHYTPRRRRRSDDPYSPGGRHGCRPDRATTVYAQRCREAYKGVPVVIGGIEASLRRVAHWDHWGRNVRPSVLATSKADLLAYGMGERVVVDIARILDRGEGAAGLRALPSTCHLLGHREASAHTGRGVMLPSFEECKAVPDLLADVTREVCRQRRGDPPLLQPHGTRMLVHAPPAEPPATEDLDRWFGLTFSRQPHPSTPGPVPALDTVRWSVQTHRGCFGGCSFCSLSEHQGRKVVSRSRESVLAEVDRIARDPAFRGEISDLGGPSANMYGLSCSDPAQEARCRRRSCLWPNPCKLLDSDPDPWIGLLRGARKNPRVRQVRVASGVRMDLLLAHPRSLAELVAFHVGGQLKVAPEHDHADPLKAMRKGPPGTLRRFKKAFDAASRTAGKEQYLVPYLMSGHPGTTLDHMADLAEQLALLGLRPRQVQDFTPTPMTLATAQHVCGVDPLTREPVQPCRGDRARADQRAVLQWYLPQYRERGTKLLRKLGRADVMRGRKPDKKRHRRRR
jgi:uncharacterized radical SAM protein YgiQ